MLEIQLDDTHSLVSDSMNYVLQRRGIVKEGKNKGNETFTPIGYFSTIENALKAYKQTLIRKADITTINELLIAIKTIDKHIEDILGGN